MVEIRGIALICDNEGMIKNVLRDDFNTVTNLNQGTLFTSVLNPESRNKALDMMLKVKQMNVVFDYRLYLQQKASQKSLYFLGVKLLDQLLIVGAENHKEAIEFTNHLHTINNQQANEIRSLLKEKSQFRNTMDKETEELFDELSKVNNELVNLQRELKKKNKQLEHLNDIKNKFMGIASHDLRNPLNVVQIYSEFLKEEAEHKLSSESNEFIKIIRESTHFMIGLVNDLLEYSKIDSGKIQLNIEKIDFVKVIEGIIHLLKPISEKKGIKLVLKSNIKSLVIEADLFKMEQLINNLVGNAIKFSYQNTDIILKIKPLKDSFQFAISNTGDGIQEKDITRLFKPFEKIASFGTAQEMGSGLGLFIVKQIIDNHKGQIWVESTPGKKTTFFTNLPVKQQW